MIIPIDDLVERLNEAIYIPGPIAPDTMDKLLKVGRQRREAASEIERLRSRLRWRDENPGTTHYDECWRDHYGCAMARIEDLQNVMAAKDVVAGERSDEIGSLRVLVSPAAEQAMRDLRAQIAEQAQELMSESSERLKLLRQFEQVVAELEHLEQAYSNKHSPQHRAAALNSARVVIDAARSKL